MLSLVVIIEVNGNYRESFLQQLTRLQRESKKELGVIRYDVSAASPLRFYVFEQWKDQAALKTHQRSDHYRRFVAITEDWMTGREVYRAEPV